MRTRNHRAPIDQSPIRQNKQPPTSPIIIASGAIFIC